MSHGFSKLVEIELVNFMNHAHSVARFDDSNILNIVGKNDSGKTAFSTAIEIIMYDCDSNFQSNYIRNQPANQVEVGNQIDGFHIFLRFSDGVEIEKHKRIDGKSIWVMSQNGKILYTNKKNDAVISIEGSGPPDIIARYLNVVRDDVTDSELNVRRNTDKLLLTHTSGGDNYKMLNSILQSELLANASIQLNKDRNTLSTSVMNKQNTVCTLDIELRNIGAMTDAGLSTFETSINKLDSTVKHCEGLYYLSELKDNFDGVIVYDEVETVDTSKILSLSALIDTVNQLNTPVPDALEIIDFTKPNELNELLGMISVLNVPEPEHVEPISADSLDGLAMLKEMGSICADLQSYEAYNELPVIDFGKLNDLVTSLNDSVALRNTIAELNKTDNRIAEITGKLQSLASVHGFKICPTCSTVVA